jgi:hypothetical protein
MFAVHAVSWEQYARPVLRTKQQKYEGRGLVLELHTWLAREREWYCMRGLRPMSPNTTTAARFLLPTAVADAIAVGHQIQPS